METDHHYSFYFFLLLFIPGSIIAFFILRVGIDFILKKFIIKPFGKKAEQGVKNN